MSKTKEEEEEEENKHAGGDLDTESSKLIRYLFKNELADKFENHKTKEVSKNLQHILLSAKLALHNVYYLFKTTALTVMKC